MTTDLDFLDLDRLLSEEERLIRDTTRGFVTDKVLLARELDLPLSGALELEAVTQALLLGSEDHREFYAAFTQGRSPTWRGR